MPLTEEHGDGYEGGDGVRRGPIKQTSPGHTRDPGLAPTEVKLSLRPLLLRGLLLRPTCLLRLAACHLMASSLWVSVPRGTLFAA